LRHAEWRNFGNIADTTEGGQTWFIGRMHEAPDCGSPVQ
jgi:hypothetical protein